MFTIPHHLYRGGNLHHSGTDQPFVGNNAFISDGRIHHQPDDAFVPLAFTLQETLAEILRKHHGHGM